MIEKSNASKTLGLELTSAGIKAAKLSLKKKIPYIDQLFYIPFDSSKKNLNGEERAHLDFSGETLIVTAIEGSDTLVRSLEIKLKKEKDIDAVLKFQAEPLLPYPVDTAILDRLIVSKGIEGTQLTVLAIKKEHLQKHLDRFKSLSIEPEIVAAVPSALIAFSNYILPNESIYFVVHLGEEQTCCAFGKEGKLIASKATQYSLNTLKQAYQKETGIEDSLLLEQAFSKLEWNAIETLNLPITFQTLKDFAAELEKVVFSLMKQTRELSVPPFLVTGDGSESEALVSFLLKDIRGNLLSLETFSSEKFSAFELKKYALPIGEALTGLTNYEDQINFLQGEFVYPHPWKRLIAPVGIFMGLMAALALAFFLFGQAYMKNKENTLRREYADLLKVTHKSYQAFEREIMEKFPQSQEKEESGIIPLEKLTQDEIGFRASLIQKELQAVPDVYPLMPNVPKVSDFLAWLSTHPNVVNKEGGQPYIDFEAIHYILSKRPELSKKQEKYQVKVEIDFTSANATAAREFHDALLAPNDFVDPKGDVKWTNNKGRYRATFFLKDKTIYP